MTMNHATVNGISMAYVERGDGIPVLFVHGFPVDHTMWRAQLEGLAAAGRLIAPDLRGFGESNVTPGLVTMEQYADDLAALLEAIGVKEPVVLCGLSMGGYIALAFWRRHAARLRGLILCDTRAAADGPDAVEARRHMAAQVLGGNVDDLVQTMQPRVFSPVTHERHPHVISAWQAAVLRMSPEGLAAASLGMSKRPDATGWLKDIECPTLVLCGADDVSSSPEEMRRLAASIPGAEYVEIPGAGHMTPLENPAAVNAAIGAFLARV